MEPQAWRPLGIEWRRPTPVILFLAVIQFWMLDQRYGIRVAASVFAAAVALDCIRIPRKRANLTMPPVT